MNLDLGFLENRHPETAQAAYDGARYYRTDSGIYLKDFGHGGSDDSAKLYSGQMLDFDGVDDYVDTGCKLVDGEDYTQCVTFVYGGVNGTYLISNKNGVFAIQSVDFGRIQARVSLTNGTVYPRIPSYTLTNGNTYRVCVVVKQGYYVKIFINGVEAITQDISGQGTTKYLNADFVIGCRGSSLSFFYDGLISNVQLWNAAFDADDVAFDYANCYQNLTADNRPGTSLTSNNLKGHWPLIEGSGDVAYDWSGNGNHGALTNFPTDDSQWSNASALDSPLAIQTALCEWGQGSNEAASSPTNTAYWDFIRCSFGGSCMTPDGLIATNLGLIPDTSNNQDHKLQSKWSSVKPVAETSYTYKVIAKKGNQDWCFIEFNLFDSNPTEIGSIIAYADLNNGVLGTTTVSGIVTEIETTLTPIGDDWYILAFQCNVGASTDLKHAYIKCGSAEGDNDRFFTGDGATIATYIYLLQFYKGINNEAFALKESCDVTNALVPIRSWETAGQFKRDYSELNFNGRSFADCGNGADVNPSTALIVEMIATPNIVDVGGKAYFCYKADSYRLYMYHASLAGYARITQASGETTVGFELLDTSAHHIVVTFNKETLSVFIDGSLYGSKTSSYPTENIVTNTNHLFLAQESTPVTAQLPLLKMHIDSEAQAIIDDDLDAWVAKRYAKAKAKYNL